MAGSNEDGGAEGNGDEVVIYARGALFIGIGLTDDGVDSDKTISTRRRVGHAIHA